jgi:very-short-patch-repair endonuclease
VLPPVDVCEVDGLRATSPARTIIDLAALRIKDVRVEAAIDSALRLELTSLDELVGRLRALRGKGRRGVRRIDRMLLTSGGHSLLERAFLQVVRDHHLPMPRMQVDHHVDGEFVARVDFLFDAYDIVVEVSGGRGHSTAADRAKDARRRNQLQHVGRLVLEFTYEDVMERESYVVSTLRQAFMSRSATA